MVRLYNINAGKKVHFLEHLLITIDAGNDIVDLVAAKGSVGTILSYEEYCEHVKTSLSGRADDHFLWARKEMWKGSYYPIKFDVYVSPSDEEFAYWNITHLSISCKVGDIGFIPAWSFEYM